MKYLEVKVIVPDNTTPKEMLELGETLQVEIPATCSTVEITDVTFQPVLGDRFVQVSFSSFDQLVGYISEKHQAFGNNPLDDFCSFVMADDAPVTKWTVQEDRGKLKVIVSDRG